VETSVETKISINCYYDLSGYLAIADTKAIYYHKAKRTMDRGGT